MSRSLEQNNRHFHEAREKLEKWADDMVLAAEKALADTKEQIKVLRRQARQAVTLEEHHQIQEKIQRLERRQRRQRREIFKVEDEIIEKRDHLIDQLEKQPVRRTNTETLFNLRWAVVQRLHSRGAGQSNQTTRGDNTGNEPEIRKAERPAQGAVPA